MDVVRRLKQKRVTLTRDALLMFANACNATCIYFEPPINSAETTMRAMQISNELWDNESLIPRCLKSGTPSIHRKADYELMARWVDALHGPMLCMETYGHEALILCEGTVFEVASFGGTWESMVHYVPDIVVTTLLPIDDEITFDGLVFCRDFRPEDLDLQRIQSEFAAGCKRGIVRDSKRFSEETRRIKQLWKSEGLDPTSYTAYTQIIQQLNELLDDVCYPYEPDLLMREWGEGQ